MDNLRNLIASVITQRTKPAIMASSVHPIALPSVKFPISTWCVNVMLNWVISSVCTMHWVLAHPTPHTAFVTLAQPHIGCQSTWKVQIAPQVIHPTLIYLANHQMWKCEEKLSRVILFTLANHQAEAPSKEARCFNPCTNGFGAMFSLQLRILTIFRGDELILSNLFTCHG